MFKAKEVTDESSQDEKEQDDEEDDDLEKIVVGNWKIVDLPVVQVLTGVENEEEIDRFPKTKLYRFRDQEWKQRGIADLRFLKHKLTNKIRILSRAPMTGKCLINHYPIKAGILGNLEQLKTSDNTWSWAAHDISDEVPSIENFGARFAEKEDFLKFGQQFRDACESNKKVVQEKEADNEKKQ